MGFRYEDQKCNKIRIFDDKSEHRYGANLKVNEVNDFEGILVCNRKFILDF